MPDIIEVNDSDAVVRAKIIDILEFDGISTADITSWGVATNRLNQAANRLDLLTIENNMPGAEARARINALAVSPAPVYPENTILPTISGTAQYNQTLTATTGTWNGYPTPTYTYQWQADEIAIPGATSSTYTLTENELGKQVRIGVTATNGSGSASVFSAETSVVSSSPINTTAPSISGTAANGQTLTAANGNWIAFPAPTFTYQWLADGVNISGATNQTLVLGNDQVGKAITVQVTATNSEGNVSQTTTATDLVTSAPINTVLPVVAEVVEGKAVTTTSGTWVAYPTPTYTYQWKRNGSDISGATSSSYTPVSADLGQNITVTVTATNSINSVSATTVAKMAKPAWAETFDAWRNFATNIGDLPNPEDIHTTNILAPEASGNYQTFAPNVLTRTDLGLQTVPTRVNGVPNSAIAGATSGSPGNLPTGWASDFGAGTIRQSSLIETIGGIPTIVERYSGTATATGGFSRGLMPGGTSYPVTPGAILTASIFWEIIDAPSPPTAYNLRVQWSNSSGAAIGVTDSTLNTSFGRYTGTFTAPANAAFAQLLIRIPLTVGQILDFTHRIGAPQLELGSFATPPILTTGSSSTVAGNRQFISGLGSQLANGVAGFVQFNALAISQTVQLQFYQNSANRFGIEYASNGQLRWYTQIGGTYSAKPVLQSAAGPILGLNTIAFLFANNRQIVRRIGETFQREDTADLSSILKDNVAFGGQGLSTNNNSYSQTRKFTMDFISSGDNLDLLFTNILEKAQIAHNNP